MTTNFTNSATVKTGTNRAFLNLNRKGLLPLCCAFVLLFSLAIGNAWASTTSNYYASLQINTAGATGAGSVYVANSNSKPSSANAGTAVQSAATTTKSGNVTMYWWVDINPGYNVSLSGKVTGGPYSAASASGSVSCAASGTANGTQAYTATATFVAVSVNSVSPTSKDLAPTNANADYPFTVTFGTSNLKTIALDLDKSPETADGKFTITGWSLDGSNVVATGKFNGGGSYGGANRNNSTTLSLVSKASGSTAKTCTVTANFPALAFVDADVMDVYTTQNDATKTGSADFNFNYGAEDDFPTTPSFTHTSGSGAFTVTGYTVTPDFSKGTCKVTVNYSFNPNGAVGITKEELKITSVGGLVASATVTGEAEAEATDDASVTTAAGVTTNYATFAAALAAANNSAGCTLTLLRNVDLGTITATNNITKAMTIDLNGKELRAAVNATSIGILTITQAVAVTIKDSKTGGRIINEVDRNSEIRTIFVNKAGATLTLESGTLAVNNLRQYASAANASLGVTAASTSCSARVIHQVAGSTVNINGGRLEAYGTRSVYGIVQGSSAATNKAGTTVLNITDGEIYSEGPYSIFGVYAYGKVNFSGGTITAHVNKNMVDARYAADNANNTYNGYGYGIYLKESASATATSCYAGILNMTGGTINVTNDRTVNANLPCYGVLFNAAAANVSSATAFAADGKSRGQIASATGSIDGGEINVTSGTQYSHGVYVLGSYNSYDNTNHVVQIKNCKITSKAYVYAYGVSAWVGINSTNGACYAGDIELTNCDIYAESLNTSTAAAVWVASTSSTIFKDGTTANAATWGGEFAVAGKAVINNGKYEAKTKTTSAYAVGTSSRAKSTWDAAKNASADRTRGGNAEAYPTLIIHGGTFKATSTTTTARGVSNGGYCTIDGGEFDAYATTTTAQGLYCLSGKLTASGVKVTASATGNAYGAQADVSIPSYSSYQTGFAMAGELELNNCDIMATTRTSTEARGVFVNATNKLHNRAQFHTDSASGKWAEATTAWNHRSVFPCYVEGRDSVGVAVAAKAAINGGEIKATAATTTAYGIYAVGSQDLMLESIAIPELTVKNAKITVATNGTTSAWGIYTQGKTLVDGCDITVTPKTTTAYGIQALAANDTKVTVKNTKITVNATTTAYGLHGYVDINAKNGQDRHGNFILEDGNDVTANATSGATSYAVFLQATKRNIAAPATTPTDISAYRLGDYANAATAVINGGSYKATATGTTAYGIGMTAKQTQGTVTAQPECEVTGGKFWGKAIGGTDGAVDANGVKGHFDLKGGVYNVNTNMSNYIAEGYEEFALPNERPEYTEGYRYAVEKAGNHGIDVCQIGNNKYKSLEEALQVVTSGQVIYMIANYTMTTPGDYVLPTNTTLLIPYKSGQTSIDTHPTRVYNTYTAPTAYYKLTFADGVHLVVNGTIQAGGKMSAKGQTDGYNGMPTESYGWLHLEEGSSISLESGAKLYAWGYVTGKGEIDAKNGSTVYEMFQIKDWRGGTCTSNMNGNSKKVFPLNQYYVQNIECPVKFRPGAKEYCDGTVNASSNYRSFNDVKFIGERNSGAFFEMESTDVSNNTWVRKWYDAENDKQVYEANSSVYMNSITLSLNGISFSSNKYVLPVTNNMKIRLLSGHMYITQNTELLPGAEMEIDKLATVHVNSGVSLYVFDIDEWNAFADNVHTYTLPYSPSWGTTCPRKRKIEVDAAINVHGTLQVDGSLYTTEGGANIFSTNEDAGTITYGAAAPTSQGSVSVANNTGPTYTTRSPYPAYLKNGNGTYEHTSGTAKDKSWIYENNQWKCWTETGCYAYDAQNHAYAKPAAYVQLTSDQPDANHLLHDAATGNRNFVWDENCYWWEVVTTPTAEGYYCSINADNNGKYNYYYYDGSANCWKIKTITVTWSINGNNTNYSVGYGTKPEWLGATPSKSSSSSDYVWRWDGWTIGSDPTVLDNEELPVVTANTTFIAHFYEKYYQSLVTFKNDDGTVLESKLWNRGSIPSYEGVVEKAATAQYTYEFNNTWSPAITAVGSSAATYVAQYTAKTRQYDVTFLNYDMSVLGTTKVDYNATPTTATYKAAIAPSDFEPYKPDNSAYSFNFSGWKLNGASSNGFAQVKGDQTYVAQFTETTKKYRISFVDEDGETVLHWTQLEYDAMPSYDGPTTSGFNKQDAEWTYVFTGWTPATFSQVKGPQTYTATYSKSKRSYTITWLDGDGNTLTTTNVEYGTTPTYPGTPTPTKASTAEHSYQFNNTWSPAFAPVTGEATYTAQFTETPRTYRLDVAATPDGYGTVSPSYVTGIPYNAAVSVSDNTITVNGTTVTATPTAATAQYTYAFSSWSNVPNNVTTDVSNIQAVFTRKLNTYTVTFKDHDGTELKKQTVDWNTAATAPSNPSRDGYDFTGWDKAFNAVTADLVVTAQYSIKTFTVTFKDHDGTELKKQTVDWNTAATAPSNPSRDGYDFTGWDKEFNAVTADLVVTAQYSIKTFTVTFKDHDGTELKKQTVDWNTAATAPSNPSRDGYDFTGWDKAFNAVTADLVVTAQYSINQYTISFDSNGGSAVTAITQDYNTAVTAPADPTREGYTFNGWDPAVPGTMPLNGLTCVAQWTANTNTAYTVKHFKEKLEGGYNAEPDETDNLTGTTAMDVTPAVKNYSGFTAPATQTVTILADGSRVVTYNYTRNSYNLAWNANEGELSGTYTSGLVKFEAPITAPTATRTNYSFDGWNEEPAATMPAEDKTYTAQWSLNAVTILWLSEDGTNTLETDELVAIGATPSFDGETPTKDKTAQYEYTFDGWATEANGAKVYEINGLPEVTAAATYYAHFSSTLRKYTITWWDAQETLPEHVIATQEYEYGETPSYTYNKPDFGGYTYKVTGWTPKIVAVNGDATYTAVYTAMVDRKEVSTAESLSSDEETNTTIVHPNGRLNTQENKLTTTDFILEATPETSGELIGNVEASNVYFDFTPDGENGTHSRKWYAVAVPWEVDAATGIFNKDNMSAHLGLGTRFDVLYYDGAERLAHGQSTKCWRFLEYDADKTMIPGRLYMVHFVDNFKTIRFKKKEGASIHNSAIAVSVNSGENDDINANWNGIANPATYKTIVSVTDGATKAFAYGGGLIGQDGWITDDLDHTLNVGQPVMVQVKNGASAVIQTPSPSPVRRRVQGKENTEYKIEISSNGSLCDRIYVGINDEKENHYVIGEDLVKAGTVTSRAQFWIDRYNTKLSVNTVAPVNNQADYPLSIYTPNEDEYTIEVVKMPEEGSSLYLTLDGKPIWNLSYGAYTADMENGTTNRYGLLLIKKSPQVATGVEELTIENGEVVRKVLVDDKVYIIRNGEVYSITGQLVK